MEEESWRRKNPGGGILEKEPMRSGAILRGSGELWGSSGESILPTPRRLANNMRSKQKTIAFGACGYGVLSNWPVACVCKLVVP